MAKKQSQADHRATLQVPADWHRVLLRLGAKWKQQKIWALFRLLGEAAEREGLDHPSFPWEEMEAEAEKDG